MKLTIRIFAIAILIAGIGLTAAFVVQRRRLLLLAVAVAPLVAAVVLTRPTVQERLRSVTVMSVRYHAGHVLTPGTSYKLINPRYYMDWPAMQTMPPRELTLFVVRAVTSYFVEPLPSSVESRALWAYLPEHLIWLLLTALVPFGIMHGLKRDPVLTCVLAAHACAVILVVALNSGNIGTLIRHRGLSLTYTVWLSALGAYAIAGWMTTDRRTITEGTSAHGNG